MIIDYQKLRVMTVVGTRPEIIRLSRVIPKLDTYCEHTLVHTGQNYDYELNEIFFDEMQLRRPDVFLDAAGKNGILTIANVITQMEGLLANMKVDALLVLGDTNSCMAALVAKRKKIPVFHMEAGNRCFDMRVPEEINRRLVDHLADINLPYSAIARQYLIQEGIPRDQIIVTGSPMNEVLTYNQEKIDNSKILKTLDLTNGEYLVISVHREENIEPENKFQKFAKLLNILCQKYEKPVIVSTHPRTQSRISASAFQFDERVKFLKPLGFFDYNYLQKNAMVTLSDSGTITEESNLLKFAAINLRDSHERPEGMEEGAVIMTGFDENRILQSIDILTHMKIMGQQVSTVNDYCSDSVSDKVVKIILSYTNFVRERVWRQHT